MRYFTKTFVSGQVECKVTADLTDKSCGLNVCTKNVKESWINAKMLSCDNVTPDSLTTFVRVTEQITGLRLMSLLEEWRAMTVYAD